MKKCLLFFFVIVGLTSHVDTFSQNSKLSHQQKKYLSSYEGKTLAGNTLPILMPYNRWIDPAGEQIYFGDKNRENHAIDCALSPDGKWIAVEGRFSVVVISPENKKIASRFVMKTNFANEDSVNTYSGIIWHKTPGGYELFWSVVGKSDKSFVVKANWDGKKISVIKTFPFEAVKPAKTAIPNELLVTEESGSSMLYVVLNGNDRLEKLDIHTGNKIWSVHTGVAPYGIVLAKGKLYVTNWAGSTPDGGDIDVAGTPWGRAKVDPNTGSIREGTVSVFDPQTGAHMKDIAVGLHPNDIISSSDGKFIYVANGNSDLISVISTDKDEIAEQVPVKLSHDKNSLFGDSPDGLAIAGDGKTLYVSNGMDNALAVVKLGTLSSTGATEKESRVAGFIPTGAYPGGIAVYHDSLLLVANFEAEGARIPTISAKTGKPSYNSHKMMASVSVIPVPQSHQLQEFTEKVIKTNQLFRIALTDRLPRKNIEPVPVPLRIGELSVFKHVLYIIRENRTYDQILGDMPNGDGDSTLCTFGRKLTPNAHKLSNEFQLMDNYYVSGKCSGEGHQWTDMGIVTDYVEKNVSAWFRSYPHVQQDALVYAPNGFIWDNALRHGKTVRIYGEACVPEYDKHLTSAEIIDRFKKGEILQFKNVTTIKPVEAILSQRYPGMDDLKIPDILRAKAFIDEMKEYEKLEGDQWPELMVMALPMDHTGGTRPGIMTPRAMVANNDLALGQIVEAVSKSRFWNNTVIFVTEDDSQSGWDHVSAYRTVGLVISPYSKLNATNHTNYNQVSMVRTIEQILGIPPMNISDATAMPMFNCFTSRPDYSPYQPLPNEIPLDEMNPGLSALKGTALHFARKSLEPQFDHIDSGDDDLFNRIIWFAMKQKEPYPKRYSGKDDD